GLFAHQHHPRRLPPLAEDRLGRVLPERTSATTLHRLRQRLPREAVREVRLRAAVPQIGQCRDFHAPEPTRTPLPNASRAPASPREGVTAPPSSCGRSPVHGGLLSPRRCD